MDLAFGPVPSRRLGRSLGINNIPNKICSYGCVYCQLGSTENYSMKRKAYYSPDEIFSSVKSKVDEVGLDRIDYITFVPDGEPTLDLNLGKEAIMIKSIGIPVAIITNSSLVYKEDVREELMNFDLISLKIDAFSNDVWYKINRPHRELNYEDIKQGILSLIQEFKGKIITETMMVDGIDYKEEIPKIASFLNMVKPNESYISVPIRPTPEKWAVPTRAEVLNLAYQEFSKYVDKVEFLTEAESGVFYSTGDFVKDLLSITSVHPIRDDLMDDFLSRYSKGEEIINQLIQEEKIVRAEYNGHYFYLRNFRERRSLFHS